MDKLTKLKEFNENRISSIPLPSNEPVKNGIACPDCGEGLLDSTPMYILDSNPPQKAVKCPSCGYSGYRLV